MPVICRGVDSLDAAIKNHAGTFTLEERKKFYEDVKNDFKNPNYHLRMHQLPVNYRSQANL